MNRWLIGALRVILACGLAGSVFVQVVMVPLFAQDLAEAGAPEMLRVWIPVILVLGIVTIQVAMVCVWRLLTMVSKGTVFSLAAFRWVDVIVVSALCAALLCFALGLVLAPTEVPPGVVLLIGGAGGLAVGVALVVLVMRALLAQAAGLRDELEGVV